MRPQNCEAEWRKVSSTMSSSKEIRDASASTHELGAGERIEREKILGIQAIMYHDTMPYKPELPYKPTNTGDVPAKHTTTTLPQIYDRESQVTVAQRNRNRGWPACPTWLIEGEARECHGDHGRCTHMGVCA